MRCRSMVVPMQEDKRSDTCGSQRQTDLKRDRYQRKKKTCKHRIHMTATIHKGLDINITDVYCVTCSSLLCYSVPDYL